MSLFAHESLQQWSDGLFFSFDRDGREQLIDADGHQVMMEWEKPYMEQCVDELNIDSSCDVLEVGFGAGYSADRIQRAKPKSHTIIECSEIVLERLYRWASNKPNVRVVEGTWQKALPRLGQFDRIFLDDYARCGREEVEMSKCPDPRYTEVYDRFEQHFNAFVSIAFRWHARAGTLISGYIATTGGMKELVHEDIQATFHYTGVKPPEHCNYFFSEKAAVPLFKRLNNKAKRKRRCAVRRKWIPDSVRRAARRQASLKAYLGGC